jgi:hypothetical protein
MCAEFRQFADLSGGMGTRDWVARSKKNEKSSTRLTGRVQYPACSTPESRRLNEKQMVRRRLTKAVIDDQVYLCAAATRRVEGVREGTGL